MAIMNISDTMTLGERLAWARKLAGLDQTEMGKRIGASRPSISLYERGDREPSFSQVVIWANESGQPLEWLAAGVECARRDSNPQPSDP
jgi:transcriptional regulator with XRE-family HTH domain